MPRGVVVLPLTAVAVLVLAFGCTTTPQPVLDAGIMQLEGMEVLEGNVYAVVHGYDEKLRAAYAQGLNAWFESEVTRLEGPDGRMDAAEFQRLAGMVSAQLSANDAWLDDELDAVLKQLGLQFAILRSLGEQLQAFNAAAGVPPEDFRELLNITYDLASDAVSLYERRRVLEEVSQDGQPVFDWTRIVRTLGQRAYTEFLQRMEAESLE